MGQSKNETLVTEPMGKLMRKYTVPCIISLLTAALYNIADQIFIANSPDLGSFGNAANTVVFPMTVIALAIAVMIGDGCCAFVSIRMGSGKKDDAGRSVGSAVLLSLCGGILVMVLYLIFSDRLLTLFGGRVNDETFRLSQQYFFYITLGIPFYMFGQAMNPVIRSDGNPRFAMISTISGAALNIILDPLFIYGFHLGMMGAALATVLGQILTAVLAASYLFHMKTIVLNRGCLGFHWNCAREYLPLGICSFLAQIALVAAMWAINSMIGKYGALDPIFGQAELAQIPMAVIGIVMKFFQIVISIVIGMAAGCIPLVGFNLGAGRKDRVKELLKKLMIAEACVGTVAILVAELLPKSLIGLFGAANESPYYTEFAVKSFRTYFCLIILACINKAAFIFLQSMGRAGLSTMLSLVREVVFGVGFALLLPRWMGLDGVLYSMPASDLLTFIISVIVLVRIHKELDA